MIVATDNLSKEYDGVYRVQELERATFTAFSARMGQASPPP